MFPVFKSFEEKSVAKYYHPTSLLSLFSEIIKRFGNNRLVDHLGKTGLFMVSWFLVQL